MNNGRSTFWFGFVVVGCSDISFRQKDDTATQAVVVEEVLVQETAPALDMLWVIDNTASMEEEQIALQSSVADLVDALEESQVSWQLGVVSTDVTTASAGVLQGETWIITSGSSDSVGQIEALFEIGTDGSAPEGGLGAAYLALTEPLLSDENRGFRRTDAALHVIVFSDDDDASDDFFSDAGLALPAESMLALLEDAANTSGQPAVFSAIVGDLPSGCVGDGGTALPGTVYADVAESAGGTIGSVCETDLSGLTQTIGEMAINWPTLFELQAEPVASSIRIEINGTRLDDGWTLLENPPAIQFDEAPHPNTTIIVQYELQDETSE